MEKERKNIFWNFFGSRIPTSSFDFVERPDPGFFKFFQKYPEPSKKIKTKKGIVTDYLPWLIIGLAVLAILFVAIFLLKDKGISYIDNIKNIFRGR